MAVALVTAGCTTVVRSSVPYTDAPGAADINQMTKRSISDDGRYVAFAEFNDNVAPGDANSQADVLRRDNQSGTTIVVSRSATGAQLNQGSQVIAMSGDGDHVVFMTNAAAVPTDTNGTSDLYVRTISTGTTERVSIRPDGSSMIMESIPLVQFTNVTITDNGRYVLMREAQPGVNTFFLRDTVTDTTRSLGTGFGNAWLSGDGLRIAAHPACTGDVCPKAVTLALSDLVPETIDPGCEFKVLDLSADGRYIVGQRDGSSAQGCPVFSNLSRWDRVTKQFTAVSLISTADLVSISNDGRFVAGDDGGDFMVVNVQTGKQHSAIRDVHDNRGNAPATAAALSGNGRYIAFLTKASLDVGDAGYDDDVYTRYAIEPSATAIAPLTLARGATHAVVTVTGAELLSGATATFGAGVTVHSVTLQNGTTLKADVSVSATAAVGKRDVQVQNTGGFGQSSGFCFGCLTIS